MNSVSASPIFAALAACANRQQPTKSNCHTIENETNEQEPQSTSTSTPHLPTINTAPTITTPSDTSHNTGTENVSTSKKREIQRHHHLTLADKAKIVRWMIEEVERSGSSKRIQTKVISQYPQYFKSGHSADYMRAKWLWEDRESSSVQMQRGTRTENLRSISTISKSCKKRILVKARKGRGRKCAPWVVQLEADLLVEFERLRSLGVKFLKLTIRCLSEYLVNESQTDVYHSQMTWGKNEKSILEFINAQWVQRFMERNNIVARRQTGKLQISPEAQAQIERRFSYTLGCIARAIQSGSIDDNDIENADETHFMINFDNGYTLGFRGDETVKYADVTSGGEGMTMMMRISGGTKSYIENPFMLFKNKDCSYPVRGIPDDVPGVCYRTGPKGWIDSRVMVEWVCERRALSPLPNGRKRILFVDNCSGHNMNAELRSALEKSNTELRYFPANATDLMQPADSFVIQKIKAAWSNRRERYKTEFIQRMSHTNSYGTKNGLLPNPGKRFFFTAGC